MNEFSLIDLYFKKPTQSRDEVVIGIGDDAACLTIPSDKQLVISTDTLVADVHFLKTWNAYDIACKSLRVNISDIAAMAAKPCWITLNLTIPEFNKNWLQNFSKGLHDSLNLFNLALIGGDTTRGPLSITVTIMGLVKKNKALRRSTAKPGDIIYVSGMLGAAALALDFLNDDNPDKEDKQVLMEKLIYPYPRIDLVEILEECASAAIDISDGLSADLNHICKASNLGACLDSQAIPIHPLVKKYRAEKALNLALSGGDDYELCFTVPPEKENKLLSALEKAGLTCFAIGLTEEKPGLRLRLKSREIRELEPLGYSHF